VSYVRFGKDSDVYMYNSLCCSCRLQAKVAHGEYIWHPDVELDNAQNMLVHLYEHKKAGHKVPRYPFTRLRQEIAEDEGRSYFYVAWNRRDKYEPWWYRWTWWTICHWYERTTMFIFGPLEIGSTRKASP